MPVEIHTSALTPSPILRNSEVDNRTSLGEINMNFLAYGSIFSLASEAGSAMSGSVFEDFSAKKVYITDNTSVCLFPNAFEQIQAELKNNDLAYWIHLNKEEGSTQADYYITCNSFDKNQNAPVSAEHKEFINNRLQHVNSKMGLNGPQTLQLTMNSLIDNFAESYGEMSAQFGGTQTSNPVSIDPETNCASTNKPTNVVTPAGLVFKAPEDSQIRFSISERFSSSVPNGVLSGFTNAAHDIYGGRVAPKGQTSQSATEHYFKGYENLSSREQIYYAYTPLLNVAQPVEAWLGTVGYDPIKKIWTNTLKNQIITNGQTNSNGNGLMTKNVIGIVSNPSKNLTQTYDISSAGNAPDDFTGWNVATGITQVDAEYTEVDGQLSRKHFIINIPRANGQEPISIFVDRFRNNYYVFNCASGLWDKNNNIGGYINNTLLRDAFYKIAEVIIKLATDGHFVLDVAGMIPVIGIPADIINGVWYYIEGDAINGTLSFVGVIPGIGELAVAGKLAVVAGTTVYVLANGKKITKFVQRIFKAGSGVDFVMDWIKYADDLRARGISDDVAGSILNQLQKLASEATDEGLALIKKFSNNPELLANSIKATQEAFSAGSLFAKDMDVIVSISKILEDPAKLALFTRLGGGADGFKKFLKSYEAARCKACIEGGKDGFEHMPFLSEVLENSVWALERFENTPGFSTLMKREGIGNNFNGLDGIQHMLRDMKNQNYENVLSFEQVLVGSMKKYDVRLTSGKLVEYKSYLDPAQIDDIQMLAYFNNITDWAGLEYVFNASKLASKNISQLDLYKKFRTIMENNAPAMWANNQNLLQNLFLKNGRPVRSLNDFEAYLDGLATLEDFSGALFSFIKMR